MNKLRCIAAIDEGRGFSASGRIPWDIPSDHEYYLNNVRDKMVLMGYETYKNHKYKIHERDEYVLTSRSLDLRVGFVAVRSLSDFLESAEEDVWVLGGQKLFEAVVDKSDELYITEVSGNYGCDRVFPRYKELFSLAHRSGEMEENGHTFEHQVWQNLAKQ